MPAAVQPPTVQEARRRLRQAAVRCDQQWSWVSEPWVWIGAAVAAGITVGASPIARKSLIKGLSIGLSGLLASRQPPELP